jgi:hypothetical protein
MSLKLIVELFIILLAFGIYPKAIFLSKQRDLQ